MVHTQDGIPLVSIIIPTRNEPDIRYCLEAVLSQTHPRKEIIVVDDSTDDTPQVVREYAGQGVRLIHREHNTNGCCGARNLGVLEASGEIIVIVNGDVTPQSDFLEKLLGHFVKGADYVIPHAVVSNQETAYARFWDVEWRLWDGNNDKEWSEGFAARREAWLAVGGIPGDFPLPFCRDFRVGFALREHGYRKVVDESLVIYHIAPSTLPDFWRIRRARGRFVALDNYYGKGMGLARVAARVAAKAIWYPTRLLLVLPPILDGRRFAACSSQGERDLLVMTALVALDRFARLVGEWQGFLALARCGTRGEPQGLPGSTHLLRAKPRR